jgi:AcrR family transcriptional regulator
MRRWIASVRTATTLPIHARAHRPPRSDIAAKGGGPRLLSEIVERSFDGDRRGCLLVNTALEIAPHDPELGAEVAAHLGEIEAFFRRVIAAAQAEGSVPPDRDPADLARLLLGVTLGVRWWPGRSRSASCWKGWCGRLSRCSTGLTKPANCERILS